MSDVQRLERARLSIDVEPDLRRQIKVTAALHDLSVRDYVIAALRRALTAEGSEAGEESRAWSSLSDGVFARDWNSEEDSVYDDLA